MGLHGCDHGDGCPCFPKPSGRSGGASKPRALSKRPRPKPEPGKRKKARVDISGLLPETDYENMKYQVLARPPGGIGQWRGRRFRLMRAGLCERCGKIRATDAHHRKLTAQGGPDAPSNLAALCRKCHDWAHAHPRDARPGGWIVPPDGDFRTRPIFLWDGTIAILGDDYTYSFQAPMGLPGGRRQE